ncbi:MAG TPA: AAA family ATPase [Frankiaceae bacterium]|jgi:SpoVK/Ycf46/Vps4 family AAA+-type ATPase|nr:AAA family ATPase [Frankiaceae bacterium]
MPQATLTTLHQLAARWESLDAKVKKGALPEADAVAELASLVGVDERGRRWTVSVKGTWTEVSTTGTPVAEGAPKAKDPTTSTKGEAELKKALKELDDLVGLAVVKQQVKELTALVRVQKMRRAAKLPVAVMSHHLVFRGNPGTGKTTVARLIGRIYAALEVVPEGHVVETDRAGLVAEYVGQTAIKTSEAFAKARGGILFIDEAYTLARDAGSSSGFGQEAIDTLVKLMEDHRDDTIVIAAGYPVEMDEFIEANPGLRSRMPRTVDFPDYTDAELLDIFTGMCRAAGYTATASAKKRLVELLATSIRDRSFGNARAVRTLFERAVQQQAMRLADEKKPTRGELRALVGDDVAPAVNAPSMPGIGSS